MNTGLANLGSSLRTTDLRGGSRDGISKNSQSEKVGQSSGGFDQIFQQARTKDDDQSVRTTYAKKDPSPVQKDLDKVKPRMSEKTDRDETDQVSSRSDASEPRTAQKENDRQEPRSVKKKGSSEKVGSKSNDQSATRQDVMLEFMDSMESEFGIPPARMVEAMTNLSDGDLRSSPEDTASQVIAQLDIEPQDKPQAYAMYMGMLAQLAQMQQQQQAMNQTVPTESQIQPQQLATAASAIAIPAAMTSQQRRNMLNNSLDQMNQKFFMKPDVPAQMNANAAANATAAQVGQSDSSALLESSIQGNEGLTYQKALQNQKLEMPAKLPDAFNQAPEISKAPSFEQAPQANQMSNLEGMDQIDPNSMEARELAKRLAALGAAAAALGEGAKADPKNVQALKLEQLLGQNNMDQNSTAAVGGAIAASSGLAAGSESDDDSDGMGDNSQSQNPFMAHQPSERFSHHARAEAASTSNQNFGEMLVAAGAAGSNRAAQQSESKEGLQQIMNQAQFMIKKGGGEAKVQLNPEGLGEIHMKVSVNDGKVGIQMQAETKEAKKLIESSMNELQSTLGQHKLSIDHLKVDVGNQTSTDSQNSDAQNQQKQMNANQDQGHKQARDFWGQFNDGGFDRRTFIDSPGLKGYGGQRQMDPMTPSNVGSTGARRYTESGKGRGLDLVA